jgi:hypothetical protein
VQKSVTQVAIEMHSCCRAWEAFVESVDTTGSPWTYLPLIKNYALQ